MPRTPRLDPLLKLLARFFELTFLIDAFGRDTGPHISAAHNPASIRDTRRRFLKNLAFSCDYNKGGRSTTALAVEEHTDSDKYGDADNTFWIVSNEDAGETIVAFLEMLLTRLRQVLALPVGEHGIEGEAIARLCVDFARRRVTKDAKILSNAVRICRNNLAGNVDPGNAFSTWLEQFNFDGRHESLFPLCRTAYDNRSADEMRIVDRLAREPSDGSNSGDVTKAFRRVRHFIGRLAVRIRLPQQLLEDGGRLPELLDAYRVDSILPLVAAPLPEADGHTNLESIFGRILQKKDPRFQKLLDDLLAIDGRRGIMRKIMDKYESNMQPAVHAEITLLEYFYKNNLKFAAGEHFIACSKPACLCCKLYFRHHPSPCVEPDSHEIVHVRWGPPLLQNTRKDGQEFKDQRKLLSSMMLDLKQVAISKIEDPNAIAFAHADSVSAFTPSINGYYDDFGSDSDMEFDFDTFDHEDMFSGQADDSDDGDESDDETVHVFDSETEGGVPL